MAHQLDMHCRPAGSLLLLEILSCQTETGKLQASTDENMKHSLRDRIESDMLECDWAVHTISHRFAQKSNRMYIVYLFTHQIELDNYSDILVFHYSFT